MSIWEDIRGKLDIVDIVGESIKLTPSGANYRCCCPFHSEKKPSLMVSREKQIWHCFGCGVGGDVFKWVEMFDGLDKKQVLEKLSQKAGVILQKREISKERKQEIAVVKDKLTKGFEFLEWSKNIYHQILLKILQIPGHELTLYLKKRNLDIETIKKFELGFAPGDNFMLSLCQKHNLPISLFVEIGILKRVENKISDKFKNRLMVPVFDTKGKSVGFTGRTLPSDVSDRPKYLNSSQSDWFKKSELLYGWHLNYSAIRQAKSIIFVEGNLDVIVASRFGIQNVLASQGTSFNIEQLKKIRQLVGAINIAFDNDIAGQIAGAKVFKESSKIGLIVGKVILDNSVKDLDEQLNKFGPKLRIINYLDFAIMNIDLTSADLSVQKVAILEFLDLLSYTDDITKSQYQNKLSQITQIPISSLQITEVARDTEIKVEIIKHKENPITIDFKNFVAFADIEISQKIYILLFEIGLYVLTFEEFYTNSLSELELIAQNKQPDMNQLQKKILAFLDSKIPLISSLEIYLELKSLTKN
jgi:DNA primase